MTIVADTWELFNNVWAQIFSVELFGGSYTLMILFHIYIIGIVFKIMRSGFDPYLDGSAFLSIILWPIEGLIKFISLSREWLYEGSIKERYNYSDSELGTRSMVLRESYIFHNYYVESLRSFYLDHSTKDLIRKYSGPSYDEAMAIFLVNKI